MTIPDPAQLSRADVARLATHDPAALDAAHRAGQLRDLLAGRDPGTCPTCGRSTTDPA